eukprot:CAMPEP_0113952414 /NCGR_PEP_ID=MMETSP1339-20121228/90406_1 /TAXON_ID=94617 /ORGANISM="Fibrocapsa japonica" /LENGTH=667 /DNA_ID=CAMNT_0000961025 /DNA_START=220 /DNA_END=2223 /DNA_ORIENTATION=- /assembly_acc=CAM_ASM_000762
MEILPDDKLDPDFPALLQWLDACSFQLGEVGGGGPGRSPPPQVLASCGPLSTAPPEGRHHLASDMKEEGKAAAAHSLRPDSWGLWAAQDIAECEVIAAVPRRCCLCAWRRPGPYATDPNVFARLLEIAGKAEDRYGRDPLPLALALISEQTKSGESFYAEHLGLMPAGYPGLPMYYNITELEAIEDPAIMEEVKQRCSFLMTFARHHLRDLPGSDLDPFYGHLIDRNILGWALAAVFSRAFVLDGPDNQPEFVPLLDLANHDPEPSAFIVLEGERDDPEATVKLISKKAIPQGHPITLDYHENHFGGKFKPRSEGELISKKAIPQGHPITLDYHENHFGGKFKPRSSWGSEGAGKAKKTPRQRNLGLSNDQLLLNFGFTQWPNRADRVKVRFSADLLKSARRLINIEQEVFGAQGLEGNIQPWQLTYLQKLGLEGFDADYELTIGGPEIIDPRLLAALRVLFTPTLPDLKGAEIKDLMKWGPPGNEPSRRERRVISAALGVCFVTLHAMSTNVQEDELLLTGRRLTAEVVGEGDEVDIIFGYKDLVWSEDGTEESEEWDTVDFSDAEDMSENVLGMPQWMWASRENMGYGALAQEQPLVTGTVPPADLTVEMTEALRFRARKKRLLAQAIARLYGKLKILGVVGSTRDSLEGELGVSTTAEDEGFNM